MHAYHSEGKIRIWQWPNIVALDAAIIAVAWQAMVADSIGQTLASPERLVLALSVWLTYTADRLFDVRHRDLKELLSLRHQFAKRHARTLWKLWWVILMINLTLAFCCLSSNQLRSGFILLTLCLAYTALNQTLSKRFFPKELCVALIFSGGVLLFIPSAHKGLLLCHLSALFFINCLQIASSESKVDAALRVRSLASGSNCRTLVFTSGVYILSAYGLSQQMTFLVMGSCASFLALALLLVSKLKEAREHYRIACDVCLLLAPACYGLLCRL